MLKNNKGITLIALVITIIVLLILAGVSIAMLTGENGILTQSQNAKEDTAEAEIADKINMALNGEYANLLAEGKFTGTTATEILENNGLDDEGYAATPETLNATTDGIVLTISKDGKSGTITYDVDTKKYTIQKANYPGDTTTNTTPAEDEEP